MTHSVNALSDMSPQALGELQQFFMQQFSLQQAGGKLSAAKVAAGWQSYVPVWSSTGTQPALGNGTSSGRYVRIGDFVAVNAQIVVGSTSTFGTGGYRMSLPVNTSGAAGGANASSFAYDTSANSFYYGACRWASATTVDLYSGASPSVLFGAASPFTFATGDLIEMNGFFEAV